MKTALTLVTAALAVLAACAQPVPPEAGQDLAARQAEMQRQGCPRHGA